MVAEQERVGHDDGPIVVTRWKHKFGFHNRGMQRDTPLLKWVGEGQSWIHLLAQGSPPQGRRYDQSAHDEPFALAFDAGSQERQQNICGLGQWSCQIEKRMKVFLRVNSISCGVVGQWGGSTTTCG